MHDCGTILHPAMVDGQIRGGFAQAVGAALFEEYAYGSDGSFLTGTFADYLLPTATEVPEPLILHMETPSPFTPLGSRASAKATACPRRSASPTPSPTRWGKRRRVAAGAGETRGMVRGAELGPPERSRRRRDREAQRRPHLRGDGEARSARRSTRLGHAARPRDARRYDPRLPRCQKISDTHFRADVTHRHRSRERTIPGRGEIVRPRSAACGHSRRRPTEGALGFGGGEGRVTLTSRPRTAAPAIHYIYQAAIGGKVASIGGRLLDGAARVIIGQFFAALARKVHGSAVEQPRPSLFAKVRRLLGGRP